MYSYAIVVGISIVVTFGHPESYVKCYDCDSRHESFEMSEGDCLGPDMKDVPTCVGETCMLYSTTCSGTDEECKNLDFLSPKSKIAVNRGCTNYTIDSDNCGVVKYTLYSEATCLCKGDLCNAGATVKAFPKITLAFFITPLLAVILLQ